MNNIYNKKAVIKSRAEVCSLLLSYQAQAHLCNCYQKTAFDLAAEQGGVFHARFLLDFLGYSLLDAINCSVPNQQQHQQQHQHPHPHLRPQQAQQPIDLSKIKRLFDKMVNEPSPVSSPSSANAPASAPTSPLPTPPPLAAIPPTTAAETAMDKCRHLANFKHCRTLDTPLVDSCCLPVV